jgi:hypothetical protein
MAFAAKRLTSIGRFLVAKAIATLVAKTLAQKSNIG